MKPGSSPDVTALLKAWSAGSQSAEEQLWPIVYAELSKLAHRYIGQERPDHTLESAALVNEAYLRLVDWKQARWENRAHFFGMCARIMRQILVDHARARLHKKRGGGASKVSLDGVALVSSTKSAYLLVIDEALKRLTEIHPRKAQVVETRFFAGLSAEETAEALKVSRLTVIRDWNFARAWLLAEMSENNLRKTEENLH
jgi:RNA polymerase sigma factor (TIGR02999 family)